MNEIYLIGYGSQGKAWAHNLRDSGWKVHVTTSNPNSRSAIQASQDGFSVLDWTELQKPSPHPRWIAFLCQDALIGALYKTYLSSVTTPLRLVLAHGFAVYSGALVPTQANHQVLLLAPKAIGPKLRSEYQRGTGTHPLVAGFFAPPNPTELSSQLTVLGQALGFQKNNLIHTSLDDETIGDLVSEQLLLCGGIFTLLELTQKNMRRLGLNEKLIQEECITEMKLIVDMIAEFGLEATRNKISAVALAGSRDMKDRLYEIGLDRLFEEQTDRVKSKEFLKSKYL